MCPGQASQVLTANFIFACSQIACRGPFLLLQGSGICKATYVEAGVQLHVKFVGQDVGNH